MTDRAAQGRLAVGETTPSLARDAISHGHGGHRRVPPGSVRPLVHSFAQPILGSPRAHLKATREMRTDARYPIDELHTRDQRSKLRVDRGARWLRRSRRSWSGMRTGHTSVQAPHNVDA